MSPSEVIIGLEVHIQLKLNSKLFCSCSTVGEEEPNTRVCPICLGHPGTKPLLNKKAVDAAVRLGLALGSTINKKINFSRKQYFYPDLAKNYQITQYEIPVAISGSIVLSSGKIIDVARIHIEEDPAALTHTDSTSLIDYNRSGIPLIELVTKPVMNSPDEAREFLNTLLTIIGYLDIFDQNTGIMKADANISIAEKGFTRVEIKNILGFKEIERALSYELARQKAHPVVRETRSWDAVAGQTYSMRAKEQEEDYGYIFEPDIPPINISAEYLEELKKTVPELPSTKSERWVKEHKIDAADSKIIASELQLALLFEQLIQHHNPVLIAKWLRRELLRVLNLSGKTVADIKPDRLHELFALLESKTVTDKIGQKLIEELAKSDFSPRQRVEEQKLGVISDGEFIAKLCKDAIAQNPKAVSDYKAGEEKALHFLFGKVMASAKGKAKPDVIKQILKELL
ncbi:MAG: Asp-tRNA(Asn)/Glu-tRNA(Gln) amidotransferase subunit GatB [Candidatus Aenigmarchaeota archaeon]|nr:Asp-tRNA(Asn)/Glu-tRNA(Gln) amidotransferase subunit GatB [Candidatus Aenigmarchaeota archaeon]